MDIKRKDAAQLIDQIRVIVAEEMNDERVTPALSKLADLLMDAGLTEPKPCTGAAHSNAHIDNCGVCLNFDWGWVGEKTKVK